MKCQSCNHENTDGKFCSNCGALLSEASETTEAPEIIEKTASADNNAPGRNNDNIAGSGSGSTAKINNIFKLKYVIPAIIAIILILAVALSVNNGSNFPTAKDNISFFDSDGDVAVCANMSENIIVDGALFLSRRNLDGNKAAILTDHTSDKGGSLWYITTKGKQKVDDGVRSFALSGSGDFLAYFSEYNDDDQTGVLSVYNARSKKSKEIIDDANVVFIVMSPDGKSFAYTTKKNEEEISSYICKNGKKPEKLDDGTSVIAISNGAKYVYYLEIDENDDPTLFVKKGKNEVKLGKISYNNTISFNEDLTEIVFSTNGNTYISRKGNDKEKLANDAYYAYIATPDNLKMIYSYGMQFANILAIKTFADKILVAFRNNLEGSDIYYIDKRFEPHKSSQTIISGNMKISKNGKDVVLINDHDQLCRAKASKLDEETELDDDIIRFEASSDGKLIYYINSDEELMCVKGESKPKKIADDVDPYNLVISNKDNAAFFTDIDGSLYYSKNGGKKYKVEKADDVKYVYTTPSFVYYITNFNEEDYTYDVYRSNGSKKFKLFEERLRTAYDLGYNDGFNFGHSDDYNDGNGDYEYE